jgi:hypothetical protein
VSRGSTPGGRRRIAVRVRAALRKNLPDLKTLVTRRYPAFVHARRPCELREVPVFHFHEVQAATLEEQLEYLRRNGYTTLDVSEWLAHRSGSRTDARGRVVLSFDDGHVSLFRVAFPLLRRYGFRAVAFICPGLVPEPIEDDGAARELCDWAELRQMHDSGYVVFQSHGLRHDLVNSAARLDGFLDPEFQSSFFGPGQRPVVLEDGGDLTLTCLWPFPPPELTPHLGLPLFALRPRLATRSRFVCRREVVEHLQATVRQGGGREFFRRPDWRRVLDRELRRASAGRPGDLIAGNDYQGQVEDDLVRARETIEHRLPGARVEHACAPWFRASPEALATARRTGHRTMFLGAGRYSRVVAPDAALPVERLPNNYLFRLPGEGRKRLFDVCTTYRQF